MYQPYGSPPPGYYAPHQQQYYQQPYGAPPPYAPPPRVLKTQEGIKYMTWYILFSLIVSIVGALFAVGSIFSIGLAIAGACLLLVFGFVAFIMFILAAINLWNGKDEFGPRHSKNIFMSVVYFIIIIVMTIVSTAAVTVIAMNAAFSGDITTSIWLIVVVPTAIGIVNAILWGLIMISIVKEFMEPEEMTRGMMGLGFYILGAMVNLVVAVVVVMGFLLVSYEALDVIGYAGGFFSFIGDVLFYFLYKGVLDRFVAGRIKPPTTMGAPPLPGQYYPGASPYGGPPPGYGPAPGYGPPGYQPPPQY